MVDANEAELRAREERISKLVIAMLDQVPLGMAHADVIAATCYVMIAVSDKIGIPIERLAETASQLRSFAGPICAPDEQVIDGLERSEETPAKGDG